jgi:putative heme-binding domain-containing protein
MKQLPLALLLLAAPLSAQDPPAVPDVLVFAPGVVAREIPVHLTNINNVRYAADGRLFAAGYDGRVHVLTDTDGDGLEDKVTPFWDKRGELLTPVGMEIAPEGVYIASRGRVSLLKDVGPDGLARTAETVVSGWVQEKHNGNSRNDASGVALDPKGNLYFSLGCSDYTNAWLLDKQGVPHYDLKSERGTILKVSPDRKSREIVCTGIRFAVGLAFNKHGDLFATDQEGDTFFPGGNPLDELLHIVPGRHYGFPFRHPKYLPNVFDEPATVEFGPQHQSSCGLCFNEEKPGRARFGPPEWEGDAIVPGFSRGKLWRVPLVKTRSGYVGKPVLLAQFNGLAVDVALSPKGDVVVACHGGKPDWGSGPNGEGRLWKLSWTGKDVAQPALAWPSGPLEVKVAFDRAQRSDVGNVAIDGGEFVRAADRFERIRPGYKVIPVQLAAPRHALKVSRTALSDDGRTLRLFTGAHPWRCTYGLSLPGAGIETAYDLSGIEASWIPEGASAPAWTGWLPHATTVVAAAWTRGSVEHDALKALWQKPGRLTLTGQVFPPVPGATLLLNSSSPFDASAGDRRCSSEPAADGRQRAELRLPDGPGPFPLEFTLRCTGTPDFEVDYRNPEDPTIRPLKAEMLSPSWVPATRAPKEAPAKKAVAAVTGDPAKGRAIFFGPEARCSVCHSFRGEGGHVAPDLSPQTERDPEAVLRDIVEPNAAINPEFVTYVVQLTNGDTVNGVVLSQDADQIVLVDAEAKERPFPRSKIRQFRASALSLMPEGFKKLGDEKLRDLVAYLCTPAAAGKRD